jgi:L-alanine-DL-glutamate epimerase-like enolase superfamily enzyme
MRIESVRVRPVSFRLRRPFITAAGRKSETHNVQVWLHLENGLRGFGEASSSLALAGESPVVLERALRRAAAALCGRDIRDYRALTRDSWRLEPGHPTAAAAVECALFDAYARFKGRPLYRFLGGRRTFVETDLTLSVGEPETLSSCARAAARRGFHRFKVKLGLGSARKNADRVCAVHEAVPQAELVADGNQGMSLKNAIEFSRILEVRGVRLVFLEQPFHKGDLAAMRDFRKHCRTPLLGDESVFTPADARRLFASGAADGVNIKLAKSGLLGALEIIGIAKRLKKILAIGCMEESRWGLAASVHLACGAGVFDWVDLDSVFLLKTGPKRGGFHIEGPRLSIAGVRAGAGIS